MPFFVIFLWYHTVMKVYYMPSSSMQPTILPNDRFIVSRYAYNDQPPRYGDIVVFKAPEAALIGSNMHGEVDFVKRVIGLPGQKIEIVNRRLRINGQWKTEPWAWWSTSVRPDRTDYFYDSKIVNGKVYTREYTPYIHKAGLWAVNNVIVPDAEQKRVSRAPAGVVPPDQFFVLGDNRSNSNDSHIFGFVSRKALRGRVNNIILPVEHQREF